MIKVQLQNILHVLKKHIHAHFAKVKQMMEVDFVLDVKLKSFMVLQKMKEKLI